MAERPRSTFPDWDQLCCGTHRTAATDCNGEQGRGHPANRGSSAPSSCPWVAVLIRPKFGHMGCVKCFSCGCNSAVQLAELHLLISSEHGWVTHHTSARLCCRNVDGCGTGRYSEA